MDPVAPVSWQSLVRIERMPAAERIAREQRREADRERRRRPEPEGDEPADGGEENEPREHIDVDA